jgi:hypothetical protein
MRPLGASDFFNYIYDISLVLEVSIFFQRGNTPNV